MKIYFLIGCIKNFDSYQNESIHKDIVIFFNHGSLKNFTSLLEFSDGINAIYEKSS